MIEADEGPRADTSMDALAKLAPVFKEDGTVTAGNSSPMNDGAAALILATEAGLATHGLTPMARIVSSAAAGVHPDVMGIGPVPASEKAMKRAGIGPDDLDLVEINEAFASQAVASIAIAGDRSGAGQRQRRGDRHRAPARGFRGPDPHHPHP